VNTAWHNNHQDTIIDDQYQAHEHYIARFSYASLFKLF